MKQVIYVDTEGQNVPLLHSDVPFSSFLSSSTAKSEANIDVENDIALMPFSSGTTGPPKEKLWPIIKLKS